MYLFLPYCVRKWHNKTVQSVNQRNVMVNSSQFQSNDSDIVASANASYQKVSNQRWFWRALIYRDSSWDICTEFVATLLQSSIKLLWHE